MRMGLQGTVKYIENKFSYFENFHYLTYTPENKKGSLLKQKNRGGMSHM